MHLNDPKNCMRHKIYKKLVLVILDGFGVASYSRGNAIALANPSVINAIVANYPSLTLQASGPLVGLPWGEMGNSEVGHLNIGAGRVVGQDLPRITHAIENGEFFKNPVFLQAIEHVKKYQSKLHLMGMLSSGGIHSLDEHCYALLGLAEERGLKEVFVHMFTDGRDTAEKVALDDLVRFNNRVKRIGINAQIATVSGRFYAMDRGEHWDQTEVTYQAIVNGIGEEAESAEACLAGNYDKNITDEMIKPTVIMKSDIETGSKRPLAMVEDNDAVIFFNFRPDRAVQLTRAFVEPQLMQISSRHQRMQNLYFVTMTQYFADLPVGVAFPLLDLKNNLGQVLATASLRQFHIAESEKYAHITSFINGGISEPLRGEERVIVTSPNNTKNYSDHPEMSADKLVDVLIEKLTRGEFSFYVANLANPDMVGHTGNLASAVKAVKCVDALLGKLLDAALQLDAALLITADHGNVEQMLNIHSGEIDKDHTTNPVPLMLAANEFKFPSAKDKNYLALSVNMPDGVISDIAPTILDLMGLPKPAVMTGINLLPFLESQVASSAQAVTEKI